MTEAIRTALEALNAAYAFQMSWDARLRIRDAIATLTAEMERPASQWPLKPLDKVQVYLPDSEVQAVCRPVFAYFDAWSMGELEDRLKAPPAERSAPEPVAWQPIETAPEAGEFLVYMPNEKTKLQVAKWHPNVKVIGNVFAFDLTKPTHWMPLPTAPKAEA